MSTHLPAGDGFLGVQGDVREPLVEVIPFGLEASVTFGGGTSEGPGAMIRASHEVELYDDWFGRETVHDWGVRTRRPVAIPEDLDEAIGLLSEQVDSVLEARRFPFVFGGEHSITPGAIRPAVARFPDLMLLHFDAHADLRDGYQGIHFSHASAIRRCLDHPGVSALSFGIRNISREEVEWLDAGGSERVQIAWAREKRRWDLSALLEPIRDANVWITFDVDGLDASLMPATGTPEPGGLFWDDVMDVLDVASRRWGRVVGMDVNELAPLPGFHSPDFVAARLAYRMLGFALSPRAGTRVASEVRGG